MSCIFCRIVGGETPSFKVFEDEHTLAFMDINPVTEGHVLVIPKTHSATLFDVETPVLTRLISTVRKVAIAMKQGLGLSSLNLLQANGRWAHQTVEHLHFHLIPRREGDGAPFTWPLVKGDSEKIGALAERIHQALNR